MDGILNYRKPVGLSSARAVAQVKRLLPRGVKIGHAGTLDPFADGVLLLLVGKATRQCERLMDKPKQYEATVKFGATTATDDRESAEIVTANVAPPSIEALREALPHFIGTIQQRPPDFSAMKIAGRRAYDLARKGHDVQLAPRPVLVYSIELLDYTWPFARIRIDCGRGTYIRSIARDLGQLLGVGGYLTQLTRTASGDFTLEQSVTLQMLQADGVEPHLHPLPAMP
ncbi:MAG TPA: tRNA pseudouridine(55) synthase TruB [Tepidisphaeraceae bacterium]|jgi:tRNA pseudouridine55 synthase